jgi:hypothetical protein
VLFGQGAIDGEPRPESSVFGLGDHGSQLAALMRAGAERLGIHRTLPSKQIIHGTNRRPDSARSRRLREGRCRLREGRLRDGVATATSPCRAGRGQCSIHGLMFDNGQGSPMPQAGPDHTHKMLRRKSDGVTPTVRRNEVVNELVSAKPSIRPTSVTERVRSSSKVLASSMRRLMW